MPRINHVWFVLGQFHARNNDDAQARAAYDEAIHVTPESEKSVAYRIRAGSEAGRSQIEPAIAHYAEAIRRRDKKLEPTDAPLFAARAGVYLARGDTDGALADYDEAIRLDPKLAMPEWH
jgi:tetratricopeptide (TPR) repeat protein